jgi:hypothetical protein
MKVIELKRADGSVVRLHQSKTNPHAYFPILNGRVMNMTARFDAHLRAKYWKKK